MVKNNCVKQNVRTRASNKVKLKMERPKREKYKRGPLYRGMLLWNELHENVQKLESVHMFKNKIKQIIK